MNDTADTLRIIRKIEAVTEEALDCARKGNMSGVSGVLTCRRYLLEAMNGDMKASCQSRRVKTAYGRLLSKDAQLRHLLQRALADIRKKRETCTTVMKLRKRFLSRRDHMPRFIDKKI